MTADGLTDADREYARRWAAARGKRPLHTDPDGDGGEWGWDYLRRPTDPVPADPEFLPWAIGRAADRLWFGTEAAAWDALALALRRVRADAAIPGERVARITGAVVRPVCPVPEDYDGCDP